MPDKAVESWTRFKQLSPKTIREERKKFTVKLKEMLERKRKITSIIERVRMFFFPIIFCLTGLAVAVLIYSIAQISYYEENQENDKCWTVIAFVEVIHLQINFFAAVGCYANSKHHLKFFLILGSAYVFIFVIVIFMGVSHQEGFNEFVSTNVDLQLLLEFLFGANIIAVIFAALLRRKILILEECESDLRKKNLILRALRKLKVRYKKRKLAEKQGSTGYSLSGNSMKSTSPKPDLSPGSSDNTSSSKTPTAIDYSPTLGSVSEKETDEPKREKYVNDFNEQSSNK